MKGTCTFGEDEKGQNGTESHNNFSEQVPNGEHAENLEQNSTGNATKGQFHANSTSNASQEPNINADGHNGAHSNKAYGSRSKAQDTKGKQSYASLFKDNRIEDESSRLEFIAPPTGNIKLGSDEIDSVENAFGYCLVWYVMGPRPSPYAILNFIKGWGGQVKFFFKDNGWIKFQFASEIDRDKVLNGGHYMIMGRQLCLKKLPSCFLFAKEDMEFLPSWIQIHGLPADCWTIPAMSKITSVIGKPIHTDKLTVSKKGSTYARVLVEIDMKKPRIWEYHVDLPTGKVIQIRFNYEMDPKFCTKCKCLGHLADVWCENEQSTQACT